MYLTIILFIILYVYIRKLDKNYRLKMWITFFLGITLIVLHTLVLYNSHGIWFAGSDATEYYNDGVIVKNLGLNYLIDSFKYKYWGYNIFNALAMFPDVSIGLTSLFIRINNLTIYMFSFIRIIRFAKLNSINLDSSIKKIILVSFVLIGFWGSFFNFRDTIVSVLLIFILTYFFSNSRKRKKILPLLFYSSLLLLFRDEMLFLVVISIFGAFFSMRLVKFRNKAFFLTFVLFCMFFIYAFIPLPTFDKIADSFGQYGLSSVVIRRLYGVDFIFMLIKNFISSILGLNPFKYAVFIITDSFETTWVLTSISGLFSILFGFISYFLVMPFFILTVFSDKIYNSINNPRLRWMFISTFTLFLITIMAYSVKLGNVQERIRLMIFPIYLLSLLIPENNNIEIKNYKKYVFVFWGLAFLYLALTFFQ